MLTRRKLLKAFVSLGLLLGVSISSAASAQAFESVKEQTGQFRRIEQPLPLKVSVTLGGLGLIGLELWWFQFSKTKAQQARVRQDIQEIGVTVNGGYEPNRIVVQAGQTVRLNFFRKDPSSCLEKVLLPDFHRSADLILNQTTSVEFTPQQPGTYTFQCRMNMFRGVLVVQGAEQTAVTTELVQMAQDAQTNPSEPVAIND
ncbi:MAG: cupredoxin domain-containing protein [Leptolyngbyaceae cyanobacterium MO_188.B28]|nr:cupredoxin domain-containing protein [Leptolyngbyaceae cyanobacterium MO_188.B28]